MPAPGARRTIGANPREAALSQPSLYIASLCYGGLASAQFLRSILALRRIAAVEGVALELDFGGGEALVSRGRAGMLARFLAGEARHLAFLDCDRGFDASELTCSAQTQGGLLRLSGGGLLISRPTAQAVARAHADQAAGLSDVRSDARSGVAMVFDTLLDPQSGAYLADLAAFEARARA